MEMMANNNNHGNDNDDLRFEFVMATHQQMLSSEDQDEAEDRRAAEAKVTDLLRTTFYRIASDDETLVSLPPGWLGESVEDGHNFWGWSYEELEKLGIALTGNTHLKHLTILMPNHFCLGPDSTAASNRLCQGIAQSQLHQLTLGSVCCQVQGRLLQGAAMSATLRELVLHDVLIVESVLLTQLLLQHPASARQQCRLTKLELTRCHIDNLDMMHIAVGLADNHSLETLRLANNHITSVGVMYFCQHWREDSPLQQLDLKFNEISANGALYLLEATTRHAAFTNLVLQANPRIGHEGLASMGAMLPQLHLTDLDLSSCVWQSLVPLSSLSTTTTATSTSSALLAETSMAACRALAHGLRNNSSLVTLFLGKNHLTARGAQLLMQAVASHPRLERLMLALDDSIGLMGIKLIGEELPNARRLSMLELTGTCPLPWPSHTKLGRRAGQALVRGVQHNFSLQFLRLEGLPAKWDLPIQFYISVNRSCRPLFSDEGRTPAIWPHVLAHYYHRNSYISHMYFCLREQPWLVPPTAITGR